MFDKEAQNIGNAVAKKTLDDVHRAYEKEITNFSINRAKYMRRIQTLTNQLILNYDKYKKQFKKSDDVVAKLQAQKHLIYKNYLELQNLINNLNYQKVVMTYVHVDPVTGARELRIVDNDIKHLAITDSSNAFRSFTKLSYVVDSHYSLLVNSLSDSDNKGLQDTAQQVTWRFQKYKRNGWGRILWKHHDEWYGYRSRTVGPINEAFTNFYLREVQLNNSLEENIHIFMTSEDPPGVIYADKAKGFLLGDYNIGGLHFAVKGAFSSPLGFDEVIDALKEFQASGFSQAGMIALRELLITKEKEKAAPLVEKLSSRSIQSMVRYHGEDLIKRLYPSK